jgi:hypothetical protein
MASLKPLAPFRRSCRPSAADTLEVIAARELPAMPRAEAVAALKEWNPHLARGRRDYSKLLVSDIVFLEAPPARSEQGGW